MGSAPRNDPDCPVCNAGVLMTKDSLKDEVNPSVIRRRIKQCRECGYRCTTHEVIVADTMGLANSQARNALDFLRAVESAAEQYLGLDAQARRSANRTGKYLETWEAD